MDITSPLSICQSTFTAIRWEIFKTSLLILDILYEICARNLKASDAVFLHLRSLFTLLCSPYKGLNKLFVWTIVGKNAKPADVGRG